MWQMLFAKVADGIAYQGGFGLWSDIITISGDGMATGSLVLLQL